MQRRLIETKVYYKLFLCLKRNVSQTFKSSSCKKVFPKCAYYRYNLLRWMLFIPCDNWKNYFLYKFIATQGFSATTKLLRSLKQVFWKESAVYICYLHYNITLLLIPKIQNKAINVLNKIDLLIAFFLLFQSVNVPPFSL